MRYLKVKTVTYRYLDTSGMLYAVSIVQKPADTAAVKRKPFGWNASFRSASNLT